VAKLYVPLDGATLTSGELEEGAQRGTVGRTVKTSVLAAAKINGDPWDLTGWSTSGAGTTDIVTVPEKIIIKSGTTVAAYWVGKAALPAGDFFVEIRVEKYVRGAQAASSEMGFGAIVNDGAFPGSTAAYALSMFNRTTNFPQLSFMSNGGVQTGISPNVADMPPRLAIKRVGNMMSGWYMLRGQTAWTQTGTDQSIASLSAPYLVFYLQGSAVQSEWSLLYIRHVVAPYSSASPTAAAVSIACTQEIDPADAELIQLYRANWWDENLTVGADTDTYVKVRYGVDGGAKSAWYTLAAYKALAAFTPTASVEFDLQFNGDGTQFIEAYDFCAGTLAAVAAGGGGPVVGSPIVKGIGT